MENVFCCSCDAVRLREAHVDIIQTQKSVIFSIEIERIGVAE